MENEKITRDVRTGFEIPIRTLCKWLMLLRSKTNNKNLEQALTKINFITDLSDIEKETIATIKILFIAEMNGDLEPSPSICEIYANIETYIEETVG